MEGSTSIAIIGAILCVYQKSDNESLSIPRPALFNELEVFSQPHLCPYLITLINRSTNSWMVSTIFRCFCGLSWINDAINF